MPLLKQTILDETTQRASASPRLRMNYNLHESFEDVVQRMFNALEPGTICFETREGPYAPVAGCDILK